MGRRVRGTEAEGTEAPAAASQTTAPAGEVQAVPLSVETKVEQIKASNLSDSEKEAYIRRLRGGASAEDANRVPFNVYANVRQIKRERRDGMLAYPPAAGVVTASMTVWDEIFKDF